MCWLLCAWSYVLCFFSLDGMESAHSFSNYFSCGREQMLWGNLGDTLLLSRISFYSIQISFPNVWWHDGALASRIVSTSSPLLVIRWARLSSFFLTPTMPGDLLQCIILWDLLWYLLSSPCDCHVELIRSGTLWLLFTITYIPIGLHFRFTI